MKPQCCLVPGEGEALLVVFELSVGRLPEAGSLLIQTSFPELRQHEDEGCTA